MVTGSKIIVALDYETADEAREFIARVEPGLCRLKVNVKMFTHYGPAFIEEIVSQGFDVFLDLKFHDIPQTVAGAVKAAANLGVWMLNVHTTGGRAMCEAAANAVVNLPSATRPLITGVTVLTSLDDGDLQAIGMQKSVQELVPGLALLAQEAGLDGVVCSAQESSLLREKVNKDFILVTPGIRCEVDAKQDQKRIMTPTAAIQAGSNYLVIGRSITQASDPLQQLINIQQDF